MWPPAVAMVFIYRIQTQNPEFSGVNPPVVREVHSKYVNNYTHVTSGTLCTRWFNSEFISTIVTEKRRCVNNLVFSIIFAFFYQMFLTFENLYEWSLEEKIINLLYS